MAKLNRILENSTLYLIGNVASRVVGFLAIPLYSRFLTPSQFGIIELIELSTEVIAITLGLQSIGVALTRVFHEKKTEADQHQVISTGVISTALLGGFIASAAILASAPISQAVFHSDGMTDLMRAAFVAMFFGYLAEVTLTYTRIQERARFYLYYSLVTLALNVVLNTLFIGFFKAGVWGFLLSKLAISIVASIYLLSLTFREVGWRFDRSLIPDLVRIGAPLAVSGLAYFLIHFSSRFFLANSVTLADLGKFALAYRFAFIVSILVADSFGKSWNATFYRYAGENGWQQQFAHVATYLMFALCTVALGVSVLSPELLYFMVPPDFYPAHFLVPLLVFAYVFRSYGDFFSNLLLINKRAGLVGRIATSGAIVNCLLNWALIAWFGIYGAAWATVLTWVVYMAVSWAISTHEHRVPVRLSSFLLIVAFSAAVYWLAHISRVETYLLQVALDGTWAVVFVGLCYCFYFNAVERRHLLDWATEITTRHLRTLLRLVGAQPAEAVPLVKPGGDTGH